MLEKWIDAWSAALINSFKFQSQGLMVKVSNAPKIFNSICHSEIKKQFC